MEENYSSFGWYKKCLRRYADFSGRARRKEYWFFQLYNGLSILGLIIIGVIIGEISGNSETGGLVFAVLAVIYALCILIPYLAVTVRRLHDTGRSGWWILIEFVPYAGVIILFIFTVLDSEPGTNKWGPNPKLGISDPISQTYCNPQPSTPGTGYSAGYNNPSGNNGNPDNQNKYGPVQNQSSDNTESDNEK
jgi:uncharacterized membrane protein YhaH (DUF805 family)